MPSSYRIRRAEIAEVTAENPPSPSMPENLYASPTLVTSGGGATEASTEHVASVGTLATTVADDEWRTDVDDTDANDPVSSSASTEGVPDPFFDSLPVVDVDAQSASHISLDSRSSRSARSLLSMLSAARQMQNGRVQRQSTLAPFLRRCASAPLLRRF
jgi:hypothetical protein